MNADCQPVITQTTTTDDDVTLTLSPVIVGSVLTIIIIGVAIAIRIFVVTFVHNLRRNRHHGNKATSAGVTPQPGDVFKVSWVCQVLESGFLIFAEQLMYVLFFAGRKLGETAMAAHGHKNEIIGGFG